MKRPILALFIAASAICPPAIAHAPVPPVVHFSPAPLPGVKPYGAANLESTDPKALALSIAAQMKAANLPVPALDLFPAAPSPANGMTVYSPATLKGYNLADPIYSGFSSGMESGAYRSEAPCRINKLREQGIADLTDVALHETMHYVLRETGFERSAFITIWTRLYAQSYRKTALHDFFHMRENFADAAAVLYMYSNYRDFADVDREVRLRIDMRRARFMDPEHDTASSMAEARLAFMRDPHYGISIIDAARWATLIVKNQSLRSLDTRPIEIADALVARPSPEPVADTPLADYAETLRQDALLARNRLCHTAKPGFILARN